MLGAPFASLHACSSWIQRRAWGVCCARFDAMVTLLTTCCVIGRNVFTAPAMRRCFQSFLSRQLFLLLAVIVFVYYGSNFVPPNWVLPCLIAAVVIVVWLNAPKVARRRVALLFCQACGMDACGAGCGGAPLEPTHLALTCGM